MVTTQAQQQLMEAGVGVTVEAGAGVEMMVMDSLDPTLLQMKTEVTWLHWMYLKEESMRVTQPKICKGLLKLTWYVCRW